MGKVSSKPLFLALTFPWSRTEAEGLKIIIIGDLRVKKELCTIHADVLVLTSRSKVACSADTCIALADVIVP